MPNYDFRSNVLYTLPALQYDYSALEPFIPEEIVVLHHTKHHQSYVDGLNKAIEQLAECREKNEFTYIKGIERNLAFNYSGHILHSLYWKVLDPRNKVFDDVLKSRINEDFGSLESFKTQFIEAGKAAEGSAWVLLVQDPITRKLVISVAENHQNMLLLNTMPIIVCDVWEHAYYLKYKNDRESYLKEFLEYI